MPAEAAESVATGAGVQSASADAINAILSQRAHRYAKRVDTAEGGEHQEMLYFDQGASQYAIALEHLREVRVLRGFCPVPGARTVVPGIFYYRGEVLSLHDLSAYMTGRSGEEPRWVIIVEWERQRLGLMARDVVDVRRTSMAEIRPAPVTMGARANTLSGVLDSTLILRTEALFTTAAFFNGL